MSNATEFVVNDSVETYINGAQTSLEIQEESKPWERPLSQRDLILQHLRSGKTLTQQEAKELYGCNAVSAVIHFLKKEGFDIIPERFRNEKNRSTVRYRLVEDAVATQPDEEPAQPLSEEPLAEEPDVKPAVSPEPDQPEPQPEPQPSPEPAERDATESVRSLAVIMDPDGPRLQIDDASYRLTTQQMRYLAVTMGLFAGTNMDCSERKRKISGNMP